MRGPKLNEGATAVQYRQSERHGTKASAKFVRSSASKARVVLDLIRGLPVHEADQVLQFTQRGIARDVRKVLASAVANATDADSGAYIAEADELFVLACFADEGPTLRRFRPRARGRATRINKRTCHITVVVARMSEERLEIVEARSEGRSAGATASRRARVERSRQRAAEARDAIDEGDELEATADEDVAESEETSDEVAESDAEVSDETSDELVEAEADDSTQRAEGSASDEAQSESGESEADASFAPSEWPGGVLPDDDGDGPDTHPIKGNRDSMLYHTPDSRYYKVTKAEVWFDTEESAEAAGFSKPGSQTEEEN